MVTSYIHVYLEWALWRKLMCTNCTFQQQSGIVQMVKFKHSCFLHLSFLNPFTHDHITFFIKTYKKFPFLFNKFVWKHISIVFRHHKHHKRLKLKLMYMRVIVQRAPYGAPPECNIRMCWMMLELSYFSTSYRYGALWCYQQMYMLMFLN